MTHEPDDTPPPDSESLSIEDVLTDEDRARLDAAREDAEADDS